MGDLAALPLSSADCSAKMGDKIAHTEDSILVRDMSVRSTLKITHTLCQNTKSYFQSFLDLEPVPIKSM